MADGRHMSPKKPPKSIFIQSESIQAPAHIIIIIFFFIYRHNFPYFSEKKLFFFLNTWSTVSPRSGFNCWVAATEADGQMLASAISPSNDQQHVKWYLRQ